MYINGVLLFCSAVCLQPFSFVSATRNGYICSPSYSVRFIYFQLHFAIDRKQQRFFPYNRRQFLIRAFGFSSPAQPALHSPARLHPVPFSSAVLVIVSDGILASALPSKYSTWQAHKKRPDRKINVHARNARK